MYLINNFLFFSILGHALEKFLGYRSGIMYLYWAPVYGTGILILYYFYNIINKRKITGIKRILFLFFIGFIVISLSELFGGFMIEKIFGEVFWDYSKSKYNIGKYVCLEVSAIWGIASIIMYYLKPIFDQIIKKIPKFITIILGITFIIFLIFTIINKNVLL